MKQIAKNTNLIFTLAQNLPSLLKDGFLVTSAPKYEGNAKRNG